MLQNIRDNVQGTFAKIIMAIIIVPFALFGIDSLLSGGGVVNVAEVNGEDITELELQQMMYIQKRNLLSRMGEAADPALLDDSLIKQQVLQQLIQEAVLLERARAADFAISDRQLDQAIINMSQFQQDGQFSPELYQNILSGNGYTSAFFKQLLRKELLLKQLSSAISSTGFITEPELTEIATVVGEKRTYRYMVLPLSIDSKTVAASAQVNDYYQQNLADFMREEQLQLEYIELKKEQFFKPVDETRVREAFELELADYKLSEERRASHIFIEVNDSRSYDQAKALAFDIESKLQQGLSFEEIAKSSSDDLGSASMGGDLGYTNGETFPEEFEQVLASLELNAVSQPVEIEGGFHIIKLTDIKALEVPKFEERKALIEQRIQSTDVDAEFISMLEDLKDHVFNSDDLAGPANSLDLSVNTSGWLSRSSTESIFNSPKVKTAAFSEAVLTDGNNSEVIELSPDHFIVVRVKSHRDKEPMPLAEVEGKIQLLLHQQQARAKLEILAGELTSQLQAGASIEEMAKTNNYDWQIEIGKSRNSSAVNRELLTAAFNTTSANKYEIVPLNNGAVAIITVEEINAGDLALLPAKDRQAVIQEVLRNSANWDFSWYLQSAIAGSDITTL